MRIDTLDVTINSCWRAAASIALAAGIICTAQAQQAVQQPYQEYDRKLRSAEQVGALTSELFGDSVNVYDQSGYFRQTDINLAGNSALPVRLERWIEEIYGIVYQFNEGKLLGRRTRAASGVVLESEDLTYVSDAQMPSMPFPDRYGWAFGGNDGSSALLRPLQRRQVTRDGVTMTCLQSGRQVPQRLAVRVV